MTNSHTVLKITVIITIIVVIGLMLYTFALEERLLHKNNQQDSRNYTTHSDPMDDANGTRIASIDPDRTRNININLNQTEMRTPMAPPLADPISNFDYRTLNDPLMPPRKRDDWQVPLPAVPTRGYPGSFHKMGYLINTTAENTDKFKFLLLMGRQKYPGSNWYDYYVVENNSDSSLKFDVHDKHRELMTDDTLAITELGNTYTVKLDKTLGYEYYPY